MKKGRNYLIGVAILIILLILTLVGWFMIEPEPVLMQGTVKVSEINVASKLVGRVTEKNIRVGQEVKKGDTLINLSSPEVYAKLEQARAVEAAAIAQSNKAEAGARIQQIEGAKNLWEKAEAAAELYRKTYKRVHNLYVEGVVPLQKCDEVETEMKAAELTAKAAKSQYDMALSGARIEDKEAAWALVEQAAGVVSEVESYYSETSVISPIDGQVSEILSQPGELVNAGYPIVSIINMEDIWVSFNIREEFLPKFVVGKTFEAKIPALGDISVELYVDYIKVLGDFAVWRATKARGDFDMRTFDVRCRSRENIPNIRPGMSVIINFDEI